MFWSKKTSKGPADTSTVVKDGDIEYVSVTCPTCTQPHKIAQVVRVTADEYATYTDVSKRLNDRAYRHVRRWLLLFLGFFNVAVVNFLLQRHGIDTGISGIHIFLALNAAAFANVLEALLVLPRLQKEYDAVRASMRSKYAASFLPEVQEEKFPGCYLPTETALTT